MESKGETSFFSPTDKDVEERATEKSSLRQGDKGDDGSAYFNPSPLIGNEGCTFNEIIDILNPSGSPELVEKWKDFARALSTKPETVVAERTALLMETKQITDIYITVLMEWRSSNGDNATLGALEEVLRRNGFQEASGRLRANYSDLFVSLKTKLRRRKQHRIVFTALVAVFVISLTAAVCAIAVYISIPAQLRTFNPIITKMNITRMLKSRAHMSSDKLLSSQIGDNLLAFSEIDEDSLQKLVPFGRTKSLADVLDELDGGQTRISTTYITGMTLSQFDELCEKKGSTPALHWIEYQNTTKMFKWMDSCGRNMTFMQNVVSSTGPLIPTDNFTSLAFFSKSSQSLKWLNVQVSHFTQLVIIAGAADTGKSDVLNSIGEAIQTVHANTTIVFTRFAQFLKQIMSRVKPSSNLKEILLEELVKIACENRKCEELLKLEVQSHTRQLVILLDGFHHIPLESISDGLAVLRELRSWNSTLLFVSTSPTYLTPLENTLNTMAYVIQPFSEDQQEQYLVDYWHNLYPDLDRKGFVDYAAAWVKQVKIHLSENNLQFVGMEQTISFIAERYSDEAKRCIIDKGKCKVTLDSTSAYQIFDKMVYNKLSQFTKDDHDKYNHFKKLHELEAIRVMFPNEILENYTLPADEMSKIGIMQMGTDGSRNLRFIHSTFVDFFAKYSLNCDPNLALCRNIFQKLTSVQRTHKLHECITGNMFELSRYTFSYSLVPLFWESSESLEKLEKFDPQLLDIRVVLLATLGENHLRLFKTFSNLLPIATDKLIGDDKVEFLDELAIHAVMYSSQRLVQAVVDNFNLSSDTLTNITVNNCPHLDLLHLSAIRGDKEIFRYILWPHFEIHNVKSYLLHSTVQKPYFEGDTSVNVVKEKITILKFIISKMNLTVLEQSSTKDKICTPIFSAYKAELILELISQGANCNIICPIHGTILHYLSDSVQFSADEYHHVMNSVYRNLTPRIVHYKHDLGYVNYTALQSYIAHFEPRADTLNLFKLVNADFECRLDDSNPFGAASLFSLAISIGRRPDSLDLLMKYVPNWQTPNFDNDTALKVSVHYNHWSAARLFLSINPELVNVTDQYGFTPLCTSLWMSGAFYNASKPLARLLIWSGADVNAACGESRTSPLQMVIQKADCSTVKHLVNNGARVDYLDAENNTALFYALYGNVIFSGGQYDVVKYLIQDAVPIVAVNARNLKNLTALEECIEDIDTRILHYRTLELLIDFGAVTSSQFADKILETIFKCQLPDSENFGLFSKSVSIIINALANKGFKIRDVKTLIQVASDKGCSSGMKYLNEIGL